MDSQKLPRCYGIKWPLCVEKAFKEPFIHLSIYSFIHSQKSERKVWIEL